MTHEMLALIWFLLLALVWAVYIVQEAFIVGVSFLSIKYKNMDDVKKLNYLVGTHWDGIEVWLILAVAGQFASFPTVFAETLTNLYVVFFLLLYILIARGVSIELIFKTDNVKVQKILIKCWQISSVLLFFVIGVYLANLFIGLQLHNDYTKVSFFHFLYIFSRTAIFAGLFFVCIAISNGYNFIKLNYKDFNLKPVESYAKWSSLIASISLMLVFMGLNNKHLIFSNGIYKENVFYWLLPILSIAFICLSTLFMWTKKYLFSFIISILSIICYIFSGFLSSLPYSLVDRNVIENSITLTDGAADINTLNLMLIITVIFLPIILGYVTFKYIRFWGE